MNLRFERTLFHFKSWLLVLGFLFFGGYIFGVYGKIQNAEMLGFVFGIIVFGLLFLQYIQILPILLPRLFEAQKSDIQSEDESVEIYFVPGKALFTFVLSSLGKDMIFVSEAFRSEEALQSTAVDYEYIRIQRGIGWFTSVYIGTCGFFLFLCEYILRQIPMKSFWYHVFFLVTQVFRLMWWPIGFCILFLLYPSKTAFQNDHLTSLGYQSSTEITTLLDAYSSNAFQEKIRHFGLIPLMHTGNTTFGALQYLWKRFFPSVSERKILLKSLVS